MLSLGSRGVNFQCSLVELMESCYALPAERVQLLAVTFVFGNLCLKVHARHEQQ